VVEVSPSFNRPKNRSDFGRAVSRFLSAPLRAERIICLSGQYPKPVPHCGTRSGQLLGFLFGLAPDGVFRAPGITPGAVGSYPAFSPLPPAEAGGGLFSVALSVERPLRLPPACIPGQTGVTRHRALRSSDFPPLPRRRNRSDPPPFQNQPQCRPANRLKQEPSRRSPTATVNGQLTAGQDHS
jgi:hypothetical protein